MGAVPKRNIIWQTVLTWFLRSQNGKMLKNPNFPGLRPQNPLRELTVRAYIAPPDLVAAGGEGTRGPLRNNPTLD